MVLLTCLRQKNSSAPNNIEQCCWAFNSRGSEHFNFLVIVVSFRIDFKILLITDKALSGSAPNYISELLTPYAPLSSLSCAEAEDDG